MPNLVFTPEVLMRIEDNMVRIMMNSWERREQNLWWRRLMQTRSTSSKKETLQWMINTAQIRAQNNGGKTSFEDLMEHFHEIEITNFGDGLTLNANDVKDADGAGIRRSAEWATNIASAGAYWPQEQAALLLKNGKVDVGYDGVPFFSANHPINPVIGAVGGTYSNLITGKPFSTTALTEVYAHIEKIMAPDGKPRGLKPRIAAGGPDLRADITQALGAEITNDPVNPGASATNMVKTSYGFAEPLIAQEMTEAGVWYVGCELTTGDAGLAGLLYTEREQFSMLSHSVMDDATLARMEKLQWKFSGRNVASYGHPFLLVRVEPS